MKTKTFPAGTIARCNRCNAQSPLPKPCEGHAENDRAYRLDTMCVLGCGHIDAHWAFVIDLQAVQS